MLVDPTREQLLLLAVGDYALLAPCTSKPDQVGEEYCPFPSVLPYTGPHSAAAAVRDIELERPCHGEEARRNLALFADAAGLPYTYAKLNRLLNQLLEGLFDKNVANTLSWHSIQIGLACALHAAGCPDAVIQLICRWACEESLKLYRMVGIGQHVMWTDRAASTHFEAVRVANIPALDNSLAYARIVAPHATTKARRVVAASSTHDNLARGNRLEVSWSEMNRWFSGSFTSARNELGATGPRRISRVAYDAVDGWPATASWHDLTVETWRREN